jgi:cyanate permease
MLFSLLKNRIIKPLLVSIAAFCLTFYLIVASSNEKWTTVINGHLKFYYGAIGFFVLLGAASLIIFWMQYKEWNEENELIKKYKKKDKSAT